MFESACVDSVSDVSQIVERRHQAIRLFNREVGGFEAFDAVHEGANLKNSTV